MPEPKIVMISPGAIGPESRLAALTSVPGCGPRSKSTKVCVAAAMLGVKVTDTADETVATVAVNVAVVWPALTVTEAGRLTAGLSALNATVTLLPAADALKVTVQAVVAGGTIAAGLQLKVFMLGCAARSDSTKVCVDAAMLAVNVVDSAQETPAAPPVKVAVGWPALPPTQAA